MQITVYYKLACPSCRKRISHVFEKFKLLGLTYKEQDIRYVPEDVRNNDQSIPLIKIDGIYFNYPAAMKFLKRNER